MKISKREEFKTKEEKTDDMIVKIFNSGDTFLLKEVIPNDFPNIERRYKGIMIERSKPKIDPRQMELF